MLAPALSVARESDDVFYTWAGPEIAVASTKAYTTQLMCMYMLALYMGLEKGTIDRNFYDQFIRDLQGIPAKLESFLKNIGHIEEISKQLYNKEQVFFIGRGLDSAVSYEGSLKLKEISYINSFAIAAGELKHGTIALMEPGTLVIALACQDFLYEKPGSSIKPLSVYSAALQKSFELQQDGKTFDIADNGYDQQGAELWGEYITAASIVDDEPTTINGKVWPKNSYSGYSGLYTFRRALQQSVNVCAVKILSQVGVDYSANLLEKYGITSVTDDDLNLAALGLGGMASGISPLEMASAYLGPSSSDEKTMEAMLKAGMNVVRLNFSHGTHEEHKKTIEKFRHVSSTTLRSPASW